MNDFTDVVTLISTEWIQDENGVERPTETKKTVMCAVESAYQSEFYNAGTSGLKAAWTFLINPVEYHNETTVEYHGDRYNVNRPFKRNNDILELHVVSTIGGVTKTIDEWADDLGVRFLDYDGFDKKDGKLFTQQFTENDFKARMAKSNTIATKEPAKAQRVEWVQDEYGVERPIGVAPHTPNVGE